MIASGQFAETIRRPDWKSVHVTYDKPEVMRVWWQVGDLRLNLHRIKGCRPGESFFHPHPWPAAFLQVSGGYYMDVGFGAGIEPPPVSHTIFLGPGSAYEMENPDAWHSVRPPLRPESSLSIMLTGKPSGRPMPKLPEHPQGPLDPDEAALLISEFQAYEELLVGGYLMEMEDFRSML